MGSDERVEKMTNEERRVVWKKAGKKANWTWQNKMSIIITLQLRGARVPMSSVNRGKGKDFGILGTTELACAA